MHRFWEIILGLDRGFLSREGALGLRFHPAWPGQEYVGAGTWNFLLLALAVALVWWVYRQETRSRAMRITLGAMRLSLLILVIALLNRPVLNLGQSRTEPSVMAILIDDSISMRVRDVAFSETAEPVARLDAVVQVLTSDDQNVLRQLADKHELRFYRFNSTAVPMASNLPELPQALAALEPSGQTTQVARSIRTVLEELQGQRIAGVVLFTDGRDTPAQPAAAALAMLRDFDAKVYPIAVGTELPPRNVEIQSVDVQDAVFRGDIVNVRATVRATGYDAGHPVTLQLRHKHNDALVIGLEGRPVEQTITADGSGPVEVELQFKPEEVGNLDLIVEALPQPGEVDEADNARSIQLAVLDAKINVLYVDGYPRWEYRYLKNEMMRDQTIIISVLLASADPAFRQEGDRPITRFPVNMEELMDYDVVLFGDVDPRQFSDRQLQLVHDFVATRGGGFGMVAGPNWSPQAFRGSPIEQILPVDVSRVQTEAWGTTGGTVAEGFRPVLTKAGAESSIFRFFPDRAENDRFLTEQIQPIFWYVRNITPKPGVGEVYAEHPTDTGGDGRRAPLLAFGRYGAGRTMFSGIDDSWRWRFYTGESVFNTYWVQQLRELARGRKLGQRKAMFVAQRPVYELGDQVRLNLRLLDPSLLTQVPDQLRAEVVDENGTLIAHQTLVRTAPASDTFGGSWTADRTGRVTVRLASLAPGIDPMELPVEIIVPRLELAMPQVDGVALARLASETLGQNLTLAQASEVLPTIPSAAKVIPVDIAEPLWDAPLVLLLFVGLITAEWVTRKMVGMV
jgi:uncharacterized membrane protein